MEFIRQPRAIETKSMEIIEGLIDSRRFSPGEKAIVKRIVHASGDPEYAALVDFHPQGVEVGLAALRQGTPIFTDVKMVAVGINQGIAAALGCRVNCAIAEPTVATLAQQEGITRAMAAFRLWGKVLQGSVVAIGNAPTALFELLRLHLEEGISPALIVGVPVGFVGAAEAKAALAASGLPYMTVQGHKGGSPIAVAAVNALLYQLQR